MRQWGDDEQSTEQRAWVLHDELITLLQANQDLSGAIHHLTGFRVRQGNPVPSTRQWRSQILVEIACVSYVFY